MSSITEKIRSMRQETKSKETKLIISKKRGGIVGIHELEEGKNTVRVVKHPKDGIPFFPFRSTWLEVEEGIDTLSRYHLFKTIKEKSLEKALGIKSVDELKDVDEDKVRGMVADELGKDFTKLVNKRVFISKLHGNPDIPDLIEEYIKFAQSYAKEVSQDQEEQKRIMAPIRGWRDKSGKWNPGILPGTNYVCYAYFPDSNDADELKRFEIWGKHMNEIEKLYLAFDDEDEPLTIDPFSDAKEGIPLVIDKSRGQRSKFEYSFTEKKNISRSKTPQEFAKQFALTQSQIEEIEERQPLNEIYVGVYGRKDFELSLNGLNYFDQKHDIGVFENDEFLEIVEEIAKYYDGEQGQEQKEEKPIKKEEKPIKQEEKGDVKRKEEAEEMSSPYGNNIDELKEYIKENNLGIKVLRKYSFDDVVEMIEEVLAEREEERGQPKEESKNEPVKEEKEEESAEDIARKPSIDIDTLRERLRKRSGK